MASFQLTSNAQRIVQRAEAAARSGGVDAPGMRHWLDAALCECGAIAARLCPQVDIGELSATTKRQIAEGDPGRSVSPDELLAAEGDEVNAKQLVEAILRANDLEPAEESPAADESKPASTARAPKAPAPKHASGDGDRSETGSTSRPTPTLDSLGCDLTRRAAEGLLPPIYGREEEVQTLVEVLCRTQKRNPLLIGAPGSGKTAIVEEFARRVSKGLVPSFMKDLRVVALETSSLVGGTGIVGAFEERMRKVIDEASQPGIVLFLDEAHTMVDAGGRGGGLADILKPALARGDLAVIAATTDDEYRRIIRPDGALERRFQPISINEMGAAEALEVLRLRSQYLSKRREVTIPDEVLQDLVTFAEANLRSRTFPDKAIDLLEQCVAHAVATGQKSVSEADANEVAARLSGLRVDPDRALPVLREHLVVAGVANADVDQIVRRLQTTMNNLDVRSYRPNLVVALTGDSARSADVVAKMFAEDVYGSDTRVLAIDLSQIKDEESIGLLIGSPPGYVGYGKSLPIHELAVAPATVVLILGAETCHPLAQQLITQALAEGSIADTTGTRYYLSDTVVLMPVGVASTPAKHGRFGFSAGEDDADPETAPDLRPVLGEALTRQVDLVVSGFGGSKQTGALWVSSALLPAVAHTYATHGIDVTWAEGVADAVDAITSGCGSRADVEKRVEELVAELVLQATDAPKIGERRSVRISAIDGRLTVS